MIIKPASGGIPFGTKAARNTTPAKGDMYYSTDDGTLAVCREPGVWDETLGLPTLLNMFGSKVNWSLGAEFTSLFDTLINCDVTGDTVTSLNRGRLLGDWTQPLMYNTSYDIDKLTVSHDCDAEPYLYLDGNGFPSDHQYDEQFRIKVDGTIILSGLSVTGNHIIDLSSYTGTHDITVNVYGRNSGGVGARGNADGALYVSDETFSAMTSLLRYTPLKVDITGIGMYEIDVYDPSGILVCTVSNGDVIVEPPTGACYLRVRNVARGGLAFRSCYFGSVTLTYG